MFIVRPETQKACSPLGVQCSWGVAGAKCSSINRRNNVLLRSAGSLWHGLYKHLTPPE